MYYNNPTPFWRDNVSGSNNRDEIHTSWDDDIIRGLGGNDILDGGQGKDSIYGGADNDQIFGGDNEDHLEGGTGNDTIDGGAHDDYILGGDGFDRIIGGAGKDTMFGQRGNDLFIQSNAYEQDFISGGEGTDTVDYGATRELKADIHLAEGMRKGSATLRVVEHGVGEPRLSAAWTETLRSIENVTTGKLDDNVEGNSVGNTIRTNGGNDVIIGGGGMDFLDGGAGNDTFIFRTVSDSAANANGSFGVNDFILGFGDSAGNQDVLDFSSIDANQTSQAFGNQVFRMDDGDGRIEAGELHFQEFNDPLQSNREVTMVAADVNGDGAFDFGVRFDRVVTSLDAGDFIL